MKGKRSDVTFFSPPHPESSIFWGSKSQWGARRGVMQETSEYIWGNQEPCSWPSKRQELRKSQASLPHSNVSWSQCSENGGKAH